MLARHTAQPVGDQEHSAGRRLGRDQRDDARRTVRWLRDSGARWLPCAQRSRRRSATARTYRQARRGCTGGTLLRLKFSESSPRVILPTFHAELGQSRRPRRNPCLRKGRGRRKSSRDAQDRHSGWTRDCGRCNRGRSKTEGKRGHWWLRSEFLLLVFRNQAARLGTTSVCLRADLFERKPVLWFRPDSG